MKLDLTLADPENFMSHQHWIGEHPVILVQPVHIGCHWTKENMKFRSVVTDIEGNIVSASFKKFFNWGEKPHLTQPPTNLANAKLMEKLDGSTLIFSRWKGHTVIRTRGTVDARKQENGYEIDILCEKYAGFIKFLESFQTTDHSYVFEWTSPSNKIVLNYGDEPDMVLTAIIGHDGYFYLPQSNLDGFAHTYGLRRPRTYSYNSVEEMQQAVQDMKGMEGICVYFHDDQEILKVKSSHYLLCHRMKSEVSSLEKLIDLWFAQNKPSYQEFYKFVSDTFDYEIAEMCKANLSTVCDAWKDVQPILVGFNTFVEKVKNLSRREAAEKILQAYGQTNRASFVFALLDGKSLTNEQLKKLLYQVLKK